MHDFTRFLSLAISGHTLVLPHMHADLDAISTAYIFSQISGAPIGLLDEPAPFAANFIELMGIKPIFKPATDTYDICVLVDGSEWNRFSYAPFKKAAIFDHHQEDIRYPIPNVIYSYIAARDFAPACSWLLYLMIYAAGLKITPKIATAVLAGFLGDDALFVASPKIRGQVLELLEISGISLETLLSLKKHRKMEDADSLEQLIKSLSSCRFKEINDFKALFIDAKERSNFYFVYDNLFKKTELDIIVSRTFENGLNCIRIEHFSQKFAQTVNLSDFLETVQNRMDRQDFSVFHRRFFTKLDFSFVENIMTQELTKTIRRIII